MDKLEKGLGICSECDAIRVSDSSNTWLERKSDPELYDRFIAKYPGKLTHTYCPEHFVQAMNNIGKDELTPRSNNSPVWPLEIPREVLI